MRLSKPETWALVHAERHRLVGDLSTLPAASWQVPSLCQGWTVHDVLAHLVDTAKTGKIAFVRSMLRAQGNFDRANEDGVRRCRRTDPEQTLADFRAVTALTRNPPGSRATRLVEAIVHGEDIRRPLGIAGAYPIAGVHEALAYQIRTPVSFGGSRERVAGLRLVDAATGAAWGEGLAVTGEAVDLLVAASGRPMSPGALTGPGAGRLLGSDSGAKEEGAGS